MLDFETPLDSAHAEYHFTVYPTQNQHRLSVLCHVELVEMDQKNGPAWVLPVPRILSTHLSNTELRRTNG